MNLQKKIKFAALLIASFFVTGCGSQVNIGYVDYNKIMQESPQIKTIVEEGQKKTEELQTESAAILDNYSDYSPEEVQEQLTEDERKQLGDIQRKFIGIQQAYSTQVQHKLDEALSAIAQEKNLDVVVDSTEARPVILQGGIDLTDEVIKKLQ